MAVYERYLTTDSTGTIVKHQTREIAYQHMNANLTLAPFQFTKVVETHTLEAVYGNGFSALPQVPNPTIPTLSTSVTHINHNPAQGA